jgi:hypothetical protein
MLLYIGLGAALVVLALSYLVAARWFGVREGKADARLFKANPTNDTYKNKFHRQRLVWRSIALILGAAVANVPLAWVPWQPWLLALPLTLLFWGAAIWNAEFTTTLNFERFLAYVPSNYVSGRPDASLWDRSIMRLATYLDELPGTVLEHVLNWSIITSWVLWVLSFGFNAYLTCWR